MANVYSIAFSVVGIVAMHSCLLVWTALMLPGPVERARKRIEHRPVLSLLIGLACSLATLGLASGFFLVRLKYVHWVSDSLDFLSAKLEITRFYNDARIISNGSVWLLAAPIMAGVIVGGAAFAQLFAVRARALMREDRPMLGLTCGAVCTSAAYFLPFVGWFVFLPLVGLMSVGAGVCGLWGGGEARTADPRSSGSHSQNPVLSRS